MNENDYNINNTVSSGDSTNGDSSNDNQVEEVEQTQEEVTEETEEQVITYVLEDSVDYTTQLETIIELQSHQINMLTQNNANQLFMIGVIMAVFVCMLLYNAIKKFI